MSAVCDHLTARAASGASASEGGEDMQQAALRVALDSFSLSALQLDFGARHYGRCEVLEVNEWGDRVLASYHCAVQWSECMAAALLATAQFVHIPAGRVCMARGPLHLP